MSEISKNTKKVITETEIGGNGVVHSKTQGPATDNNLSVADLTAVLLESQKTIEALTKENSNLKDALESKNQSNSSNNSLDALVNAISKLANNNQQGPVASAEAINKTTDFTNKMTVDGRGLMEAQQTMLMFKNEAKKPISIPKSFANQFGPALSITVNGVRVAIPVDGKTYFINKTHWEHARERLAKVDKILTKTEPEIVEINA